MLPCCGVTVILNIPLPLLPTLLISPEITGGISFQKMEGVTERSMMLPWIHGILNDG